MVDQQTFDQACTDALDELGTVHKNFQSVVQMLKDDQRKGRSVCSRLDTSVGTCP